MSKNLLTLLVALFVGVTAGTGIIISFDRTLQSALKPVRQDIQALAASQAELRSDLKAAGGEIAQAVAALGEEVRQRPASVPEVAQAPEEPAVDMNKVHDIPAADSYILGQADAPATIAVFVDYECPFSARFVPGAIAAVREMPGQARLIIKNFPLSFHSNAKAAAKAALAAGLQGKYYEMASLILANHTQLDEATFKGYAEQLKLNVAQFTKDLKEKDAAFEQKISDDMALGGQIGVNGTPYFYLNGKMSGAADAAQWKTIIEAAVKQ
jgi:protein-disulfide isomerase